MNIRRSFLPRFSSPVSWTIIGLVVAFSAAALLSGCKKQAPPSHPLSQVSVIVIEPKDTPIVPQFVGQTQSSHEVEIRSRVNGFLDKRVYVEGALVKAGDVMFRMDPKPFQAALDAAQGALAQQQARLTTARANLARVKPLVEQDALSQKDLDDATGQEQAAAAAVESAKAEVQQAKLNLGYTTIEAPVTGLSSYARIQNGAYINQANSLLTYVSQLDPIWVNFSISENDVLKYRGQAAQGQLITPKNGAYEVEIVLADGSVFPHKGRITFADAQYSSKTGTFLVRATFPNHQGVLRPGQFVRANLIGAVRPKGILVPQSIVRQSAKGHFVWVVNKETKAEIRPIAVGDWKGDDWFVTQGLRTGDQVVVEGSLALQPGEPVTIKKPATAQQTATADTTTPSGSPAAPSSKPQAGKTEPAKGK